VKTKPRYVYQLKRLLPDSELLFGKLSQLFPTEKQTLEDLYTTLARLSRTEKLARGLAHLHTAMFKFKSLLETKHSELRLAISGREARHFWYALFILCQQIIELQTEAKILDGSDSVSAFQKLQQRKKNILDLLRKEARGWHNKRCPNPRRCSSSVSELSDMRGQDFAIEAKGAFRTLF